MTKSTQQALLDNLSDSIKERLQWEIDNNDMAQLSRDGILEFLQDARHEIVDGDMPIYYSDLANLLAEDRRFADVDDRGILPENPTVWDILTASVYEWLSEEFDTLAFDAVDELFPHLLAQECE